MKGKLVLLILAFAGWVFFHFFNYSLILRNTMEMSKLEKSLQAEKCIHTELLIEHNDLISGNNVASVVPAEMSKYVPKEIAGNILYIQEPSQQKNPSPYCIIDLLTPKAEAATTIIPD